MKLLKLVSNTELTESVFSNQFSTPLVLPPRSEVALKALSMEFDSPSFVIDDSNNKLSFKTQKGVTDYHQVVLKNGTYKTIDLLLKEIQNKMNNILDSNTESKDNHFQWVITKQETILGNLNVVFSYKANQTFTNVNASSADLNGVTFSSGTSKFTKSVADDAGKYNATLYGKAPLSKGAMTMSIKLTSSEASMANTDWIWGADTNFDSKDLTNKTEILALMKFGFSNNAGKYTYKKLGNMVTTTVDILTNDVLTVYKQNGKIMYSIVNGTNVNTFEGDDINLRLPNLGTETSSMFFHYGDDVSNIELSNISYLPDYLIKENSGVYTITNPLTLDEIYYETTVSVGVPSNIIVFLTFDSLGIRKLLGFNDIEYKNSAVQSSFISDAGGVSVNLLTGNDLEVEIIELADINTYTETFRQKRSMIMSITNSELSNSIISLGQGRYELSFHEGASFCFISLDNEHPQQIPQMTVRITSGGLPVQMSGKITALILYQYPKV